MINKIKRYNRRAFRVSYKVKYANRENQQLPLVIVKRSNQHISVQILDIQGNTITYASSNSKAFRDHVKVKENAQCKSYNILGAQVVGEIAAQKCCDLKIYNLVYNRQGYSCHGRVKALFQCMQQILQQNKSDNFIGANNNE